MNRENSTEDSSTSPSICRMPSIVRSSVSGRAGDVGGVDGEAGLVEHPDRFEVGLAGGLVLALGLQHLRVGRVQADVDPGHAEPAALVDVVALGEAQRPGVDHHLDLTVVDQPAQVRRGGLDQRVHVARAGRETVVHLEEEVDAEVAAVGVDGLPEAAGLTGVDPEVGDAAVGTALVAVLAAAGVVDGDRRDHVVVEVAEPGAVVLRVDGQLRADELQVGDGVLLPERVRGGGVDDDGAGWRWPPTGC
jgi:hypothetical protein